MMMTNLMQIYLTCHIKIKKKKNHFIRSVNDNNHNNNNNKVKLRG